MSRLSFVSVAIAALIMGCDVAQVSDPVFDDTSNPITREEARTLTIESIDGVIALTQMAGRSKSASGDSSVVFVFVKGDSSGSGAVITERHQTLKGVKIVETKTVGGGGPIHPKATTTIVRKYLSEQHFRENHPATIRLTAVYGEQSGSDSWIVTFVERDGRELRVTFKSPLITLKNNKMTIRRGCPEGIEVVHSETGVWTKTQYIWGSDIDGSVNNRTVYPDGTWSQSSVRGQRDGSVTRTYTSGP